MYPIGSNAINDRTIGESAQGLADYVDRHVTDRPRSCAIAYDTRQRSRHFAEPLRRDHGRQRLSGLLPRRLSQHARTVLHRAFQSLLLRNHGSPPATIPPATTPSKPIGTSGGQLLPPHDQGVIDCVMSVGDIQRIAFADGLAQGKDRLRAGRGRPRLPRCRGHPKLPRPSRLENPLFAAARCRRLGRPTGAGPRRAFRDVELFGPHAGPRRRLSQRSRSRFQSRKPARLRCAHPVRHPGPCRPRSRHRPRLRPRRLRCAHNAPAQRPLAVPNRQPDWRPLGRLSPPVGPRRRHAHLRTLRRQDPCHD